MPKSLRNKIKHLAYKGELNERERDRILNALDREVKWIPCSERLPEEDEVVLITNKWHEVDKALYIGDERFDIIINYLQKEEVIAWMPLPEPYSESEDEE
jgi:hypothetical protein